MKIKRYTEFVNEKKWFDMEIERTQICMWLNFHHIINYIINDDLSVNVNGDVDISNHDIPDMLMYASNIKFNFIKGIFKCGGNKFKSLNFLPTDFDLNKLYCKNNAFGEKKLKWNWLESILSEDETLIRYNIEWIKNNKDSMPKTFEEKFGYLLEFEHYTKLL